MEDLEVVKNWPIGKLPRETVSKLNLATPATNLELAITIPELRRRPKPAIAVRPVARCLVCLGPETFFKCFLHFHPN